MEQCRLEIEKLASSVALAEYEQEAGPARLARLARVRPVRNTPGSQEADLALEATKAGLRVYRRPLQRARDKTREQPDQER
jgi:hypothetical protein